MTQGFISATPMPPLAAILAIDFIVVLGAAFQPEFSDPIANLTIPLGRDVTFRCLVNHLGGYRVGWVKADTKAIQAIHDHVITHNPRVSVTHTDHSTWNLHIKHVQEEDRGEYMCQINTDPMISQMGSLEVVVSPEFIPEETSGDTMVPEGGTARLICRAGGRPDPRIHWRREDGTEIAIRDSSGVRKKVATVDGEVLLLLKISRSDMGVYMCLATNAVPPTISKRIMVYVNFHPVIQVPNQLLGTPLGTDVTLVCNVEASPKAINYWVRESGTSNFISKLGNYSLGEMVVQSYKYDPQLYTKSLFEVRMSLLVRHLQKEDAGTYKCVAKNSLGSAEGTIRVYDIPGATRMYSHPQDEEDYNEQFGSAERERDEDLSNSVLARGRGHGRPTPGGPRGHLTKTQENHVPVDPAPSNSCPLVPMLSSLLLVLLRI